MRYDLNQIGDPTRFQRLLNAVLVARFGEDARLTPLHGADGGSDGETASGNPYMEFRRTTPPSPSRHPLLMPPRPGRYLFQAKYHPTGTHRLSDLRARVVQEFEHELQSAVLNRSDRRDVDYFFLVTNVPASKNAFAQIDKLRSQQLPTNSRLHADVWWGEMITTFLDWSPELWAAFPEIFPGSSPPLLAQTFTQPTRGASRSIRTAIAQQHARDLKVKFRQIELEQDLYDLFVDLDVELRWDTDDRSSASAIDSRTVIPRIFGLIRPLHSPTSALELLLDDEIALPRILIEGGPGQGKSTITQMAAQIYRERLLQTSNGASRNPTWNHICKARLPIRLELRRFAEWLSEHPDTTLEQYIVNVICQDSGGATFTVDHLHDLVERSSLILLLDGLDEVGSDALRDSVLDAALATIRRFETGLRADVRVILTTRPPALTGRREKLDCFARAILTPMTPRRIDEYLHRWLGVQIKADDDRAQIRASFAARRNDPHVDALARNPMQLSILLNFIRLKSDAFPDRRADLYRGYFQTVIDRDVEKSPELRKNRDMIEGLHSYLGFRLHGAAEVDRGRRTLNRRDIIELADRWLREQDPSDTVASTAFALGEERFGLIVAVSGEGNETTYGFEVQPIQEYFAASYISNRLSDGKAHEIFELLIHKNYWHEVALFLAGLRRPNEKADLVARARNADRNVSQEWQQNGRTIVLQLLREGVFHDSRHVLTEAIGFAFELIETRHLRLQRPPDAAIEALQQVAQLYSTDALRSRIARIAEACSESDDAYGVFLIHRLAASTLRADEYRDVVLGYRGRSARARSLVRVTCPYETPKALEAFSQDDDYWAQMSPALSARYLWRAAIGRGCVLDIGWPANLHSSLVVEFAMDYMADRNVDGTPIVLDTPSPPAIWKLLRNLQVMNWQLADQASGQRSAERRAQALRLVSPTDSDPGKSNLNGLTREVGVCLRDLIETTNAANTAMVSGKRGAVKKALNEHLRTVAQHLEDLGTAGWVASRCAISFFRPRLGMGALPASQELLDDISGSLAALYGFDRGQMRYRFHLGRLPILQPTSVRLARGEPPVPLERVIASAVRGDLDGAWQDLCSWVVSIPLSRALVRALVEQFRENLPQLLRFLGERTVVGYARRSRLMVHDTRRVLKVCRETDDIEVLQGASTVLANATFARIAEPELLARLFAAAPSSQLVDRVFGRASDYVERNERRGDAIALGQGVASLILAEPDRYSVRVVSRAAGFLAETEGVRTTALFEERPELLELPR